MSEKINESVKVLQECAELQVRKGRDYQNPKSTVKQAMYYPNGIMSIYEILNAKMLRLRSLLESQEAPNNESIEDTLKDIINYCSFGVSWQRGKIPGQDPNNDMFNRPKNEPVGE